MEFVAGIVVLSLSIALGLVAVQAIFWAIFSVIAPSSARLPLAAADAQSPALE